MNLDKFKMPTKENKRFWLTIVLFFYFFFTGQINQQSLILALGFLGIMGASSYYEPTPISKKEAENIALKDAKRAQNVGEIPNGTIRLLNETTLGKDKDKRYLVGIEISDLGRVHKYIYEITVYGTLVTSGRKIGKFSALEESAKKLPKEIEKEESKSPEQRIMERAERESQNEN